MVRRAGNGTDEATLNELSKRILKRNSANLRVPLR